MDSVEIRAPFLAELLYRGEEEGFLGFYVRVEAEEWVASAAPAEDHEPIQLRDLEPMDGGWRQLWTDVSAVRGADGRFEQSRTVVIVDEDEVSCLSPEAVFLWNVA